MKKVVSDKKVCFFDNNDNELMHMEHFKDEFIWFFESDDTIRITPDMELYSLLETFMQQDYKFSSELLQNSKDSNSLVWYSDCYYNPDDEWSVDSVSCLHIVKKDDTFDVWCTKELDKKFNRPNKSFCVCFSPAGNGVFSQNTITGQTLQTDFVTYVYQPLIFKPKQMCKK